MLIFMIVSFKKWIENGSFESERFKPFNSFCLLVKMSNVRDWADNHGTDISFKLSFGGMRKNWKV